MPVYCITHLTCASELHVNVCLSVCLSDCLYLQEYQQVVDAEWTILYEKLDKLVKSGAKVVLSKLPIGDVATQYFADRYRSGSLSGKPC